MAFNEEFIQLLINKTKKYDIYLDSSNLVLGGTHNHSAPTVNVIYDEYFGEPNLEYVEYLSDLYTDSIVELWNENGVEVQVLLSGIAGFEHKMSYGDGPHELIMPAEIFTFDDLQIICIPGELGSILGLQIKAASKKRHSILWGYTGPCDLGYIVDEEAYKLECQETNTTIYPCGTPEEYRDYIISEL